MDREVAPGSVEGEMRLAEPTDMFGQSKIRAYHFESRRIAQNDMATIDAGDHIPTRAPNRRMEPYVTPNLLQLGPLPDRDPGSCQFRWQGGAISHPG